MQDYKVKSICLFHGVFSPDSLKKIKLGKDDHAFICEGRPDLVAAQGTAGFLTKQKISPTIISDNMAGFLFFRGLVRQVYVACQYAEKDGFLGDTGALILAVLAHKHNVPVKLLPAEHRSRFLGDPKSILSFQGKAIAPKGTAAYVPLVEWVPAKYMKKFGGQGQVR